MRKMVIITQRISDKDIEKAEKFAKDVVEVSYNRFHKDISTRKERFFYGKLGEIISLNYLNSKGIFPNVEGMFEIYEEVTDAEDYNFFNVGDKRLDVKTAYEHFHKRIMIPWDIFETRKKDYYIGIKVDINKKESKIYGYASRKQLEDNGKKHFGEGFAYWEFLDKLKDINELIKILS